ncbi:RusA family crossover junction endodeoxyribonuclease [Streptomyces sp. G1]|uniref:RusA family crossover junction endodeoxyribonuclease n=1 Tax=Streptomyces sp. G1 TaxID=361572 RepID=UPI0020306A30|nr:RusA family crossover junction endodeoxyribonuclease [Streptomyces sp. G1]MCM1964906.1 RusA family crossover junction endodeoxyribonuclease [Streptomyces sp. G1]
MSESYGIPELTLPARQEPALLPVPVVVVRAYGTPAPQGSKTHVGGGRMIESSAALAPWRRAVTVQATTARNRVRGWRRITGPVEISAVFTLARPASHFGTGRNAGMLRRAAPARPSSVPDLSKLIRAAEDSLTDAGIWQDDALVVGYRSVAKHYVTDHGWAPDVLEKPGVVIRVWALDVPGGEE